MLEIHRPNIMLHPSSSPSSLGPSPLDMFAAYDQSKVNSGHLLVRQPHTIQIIQLVEGPPPPPRTRRRLSPSDMDSSSASSSESYPSTSDCESEEEEEECSSYCSSIVTPEDSSSAGAQQQQQRACVAWTDDTYNVRMKRIHDWRDGFVKATTSGACALTGSCSSPLKRKMNQHQMDDDVASHTSKRSRSRDGQGVSRLTGYPCPACDTLFPTRQSLRKHGLMPHVAEACRIAVEYNLE
ncbi:hypothetical protein F5I97DRAFT_2060327 [Phlebopus sp. FC_14]|nr:hypothetical protein F5I97DRAFT_2060327 [Phlebopus sp. FC_14]